MRPVVERHPRWQAGKQRIFQERFEHGDTTPTVNVWESDDQLSHQPHCVCGNCNSGWMNDIETRAQPYLAEMLVGKALALDRDAQTKVARWAVLKAMAARYGHARPSAETLRRQRRPLSYEPLAQDWRHHFCRTKLSPDGWFVWIGANNGAPMPLIRDDEISVIDPAPPSPVEFTPTDQGVLMSMLVGHLAVKVLGLREGRVEQPAPELFLRVWPPTDTALSWPPPLILTDAETLSFLNMWVTALPTQGTPP